VLADDDSRGVCLRLAGDRAQHRGLSGPAVTDQEVVLRSTPAQVIEELIEEGLPGDEGLDQLLMGQDVWVVERHTTCLTQ
jgi:hypothetical protein